MNSLCLARLESGCIDILTSDHWFGDFRAKDTMAINTATVQEFIEANRAPVYMLFHTYFNRDQPFLLRSELIDGFIEFCATSQGRILAGSVLVTLAVAMIAVPAAMQSVPGTFAVFAVAVGLSLVIQLASSARRRREPASAPDRSRSRA